MAKHQCPPGCLQCQDLNDQAAKRVHIEEQELAQCQELEKAFEELVEREKEVLERARELREQAWVDYHRELPSREQHLWEMAETFLVATYQQPRVLCTTKQ
jgi:hypothetical protein